MLLIKGMLSDVLHYGRIYSLPLQRFPSWGRDSQAEETAVWPVCMHAQHFLPWLSVLYQSE
jgi:hypothetical protein